SRFPRVHPDRVTNVSADFVDQMAVTLGADTFFRLLDAAELGPRESIRLIVREALADFVGGGHLDVRLQLVIESLLSLIAAQQPREDRRDTAKQRHAPSSTLATASETRS